ncbi:MAG TPA: DUF3667 domain-containing protein [Eudoraea sp.]|nr:DUF3667 domain-containing protein [Eudoraea sp.]
MECKNCGYFLYKDHHYCPQCGARIICNRITLKHLWHDFAQRYFDLDNTFIRTFVHLFTRPEAVNDGYIRGVRRRYLNPVSYMGISVALSGILFFVLRKYYIDRIDLDVFNSGLPPGTSQKIMAATLDFSSFIFLLFIPVISVAGWLTFNRMKYNFPEFIIVGVYTLAHYNIFVFPIALGILITTPERYISFALMFLLIMLTYTVYSLRRLNAIKLWNGLLRSFAFVLVFLVGYLGISVFINILLLTLGELSLQDFKPVNP